MLLPRRLFASCPRIYGRLVISGLVFTLVMCFLYKVNQSAGALDGHGTHRSNEEGSSAYSEVISGHGEVHTGALTGKLRYAMEIERDLAMQRPELGENGAPAHLSGAEAERGKKDLAKIALNEELSKHVSYNRTAPDGRSPHCKRLRYKPEELPSAAVIIIFYDEAFSVIVRTVHSVLNTASENLKEVILVDDASTHEELKGKLDYYIATRFPASVKLIRMKSR